MDTKTRRILDNAKVLVLDIEASSLDVDDAVTRVVGVKTNQSPKIHCIWAHDFDKLRSAIKKADFVVTYNGENYDIPVLMNDHNRLFKYETTITGKHLDLYDVVTKRESTFGVKFLDGFSLDAVCKSLGLSRKVQDFDYKLLRKDYEELTSEEIAEIEHYLRQDVNITYELYQFLEEMFQPLTAFLPERDIRKKNYIKSSMGALTYKVICHMSGLQPTYDSSYEDDNEDTYVGGHVFEPIREETKGNIKCVDYASAYPHAYMQANLYTKCKFCTKGECQYRFNGGTTRDGHVLQLQGNYCTKHGMGVRERVIQKLFMLRLDAKNKIRDYQTKKNHGESLSADQENNLNYLKKLQQGLKIIINTIYGISGSPKFLQTYDKDTAADCTLICRFNLIYMHTKLTEFGHECLYGDSVVGDTIIDVAGIGPIKIEDLFTNVDYTQGDKEYCILDGVQTPTITNDFKHSMRNVPYIMRHKTDKPIYRVWTGKHSYVDVTEDHSLIGFKNKSMVEVKPTDIDCALIAQKNNNGDRDIDDIVRTYATKIERIDHNGYVYDIEVEDTHKFFANGILVHNTDSAYVKCEDGVKDIDLQGQLDEILANLKSIYPFPQDTFKIDIEDSIKYMGFFRDECGGFKKKKYIMVLDNDEVKVKGLSVVRRDSSLLARKIWNQYITDYIKTNLTHKIPLNNIELWITDLLEEDLANAAVEFKVKPLDMYNNMTSIQARISKEYGEGKHKMIKNRRGIGVGKGVSYAPLEQAKNLKIRDLDLSRVYSDLSDVTDNGQTTFNRFTI